MAIKFQDLHPHNGTSCYAVVNESLKAWHEALGDISVERAASICSGGEVTFFAILPRAEKELVAVDHSYSSLYFALGKYGVIEKLGAKEAYEQFCRPEARTAELKPMFDEVSENLPTKLPTARVSYYWPVHGLSRVWRTISQDEVTSFEANKDKVSFVHGDLDDLVQFGPFDLFYLSNALDYTGRGGKAKFAIEDVVKPGGYILYSCQQHGYYVNEDRTPKAAKKWEVLAEVKPPKAERLYGLDWIYRVCKAPE